MQRCDPDEKKCGFEPSSCEYYHKEWCYKAFSVKLVKVKKVRLYN